MNFRRERTGRSDDVSRDHPLPVTIENDSMGNRFLGTVRVKDSVFKTDRQRIPGIVAASAYSAGDAFGIKFGLHVPERGTIATVVFIGLDDEGKNKEVAFFDTDFAETADNAAFAPSDADFKNCIGFAEFDTFKNYGNNQIAVATPALSYVAPKGTLFGQFVTRGADNIALDNIPEFFVVIL
jgi:hypothetical protein